MMELNMLENEKAMFTFLKEYFEEQKYVNAMRSLFYAIEKHEGQYRDNGQPYIVHPFAIACIGILLGIDSDVLTSVGLLHDVPEDCSDDLTNLDVLPEIKKSANILNFNRFKKMSPYVKAFAQELYYKEIKTDEVATFDKLIDRYHNLTTMGRDFPIERKVKYTKETKKFIYPLLEYTNLTYPNRATPIFLLNQGITSIVNATEWNIPNNSFPDDRSRTRHIA